MAYDNGFVMTHRSGASQDFTSGTDWSFKGPKGYKGRIIDIGVHVTTLFTNVTTGAKLRAGTAADADAYAELDLAAAAATDTFNTVDDTDAIISAHLAADTQVEMTQATPTGGTPAGVGYPYVAVYWYK